MALAQSPEEETLDQTDDLSALGLEPVSDEEFYGSLPEEEPETEPTVPAPSEPTLDFEALGLEPVSDEEFYGFEAQPIAEEPEESFLRPIADPFLNIGAGINDVVKGFADSFGADNAVSQNLARNSEWYRSLLSASAKQDAEEIGRIMQEAEGKGVLAEIGAGLKALSVAPVDLVAQGIGSLIPFVATAGLGKAVGLSKAGIAVLQGVQGGLVGGGIVKGEIYSAVKEQLISSGVDEAQAEKAANEAQAYNGKNLDQILLGVGLGVAASATGAEGAIRGLIARKVGKEAAEQVSERAIQEVLRTGFVRGAVKDGIVEAATEALQGGQERLAANIALGREGFEVEPMRGVVAQATLEGALGGILGGTAGGVSAKAEQLGMRESVALRDAAKAAQEAKESNAPASASAVEDQIEQVGETLNIPATVGPLAIREGETQEEYKARIDALAAETPEQRVARLQEEAAAAAGIELEEEGVGVEPTVLVTPPVAPTPEGAVAPVEPVVAAEGAVEPTVTEVPAETITQAFAQMGEGAVDSYYQAVLQSLQESGEVPTPERRSNVGQAWERVRGQMTPEEFVVQLRQNAEDPSKIQVPEAAPAAVEPTPVTPVNLQKLSDEALEREELLVQQAIKEEQNTAKLMEAVARLREISSEKGRRSAALLPPEIVAGQEFKSFDYEQDYKDSFKRPIFAVKLDDGTVIASGSWRMHADAVGEEAYALPVELQNKISESGFISDGKWKTKTFEGGRRGGTLEGFYKLAPLRRVARAEQTEEDVAGLVDAGFVEVYNGQPVITQAGIEALPEAERPRLTPEARKIQIDTRTSEAAAEAISKNLRIGVDQVPADVRMPAGWTLEGDIYVPPQPQAPAPTPEVREARREPAITPQQDRDYLDAVERGDLDAASRAVDAAAQAAGNVTTAYRSNTQTTTVFDTKNRAAWFTDDLTDAQDYASITDVDPATVSKYYLNTDNFASLDDPQIARQIRDIVPNMNDLMAVSDAMPQIRQRLGDKYDGIKVTSFSMGYETTHYNPFKPERIKSSDPVTRDDQGNIIPPSQRFQPTEEDIRYNPLGYDITTVVEDIKAGRTDGPLRAVNNVIKQSKELRDRIQREAARRQEPRARGKAAILDRLSRERAAGRISEETAQALTDFVNRIREDAIGDTALSIRKGGVSNFNFGETLVSFFLNQDQPATGARVGIHEFFHGLSRFLPDAEVEQMRQDYTKNLAEYLKKNPWFLAFVGRYSLTPEQFEAYKLFNPKEAETKLQPVRDRQGNITKYQIKYDADNYRYIMLDEWIAEKMTDLVRKKQAVPDTFLGKIAKVIRDFLDLIKARLGKDAYESFYQTITDPKQKLNLWRMSSVAEPFQIYEPTNFNYAEDVLDQVRYMAAGVEQGGGGGIPTFSEGSPEASTLSTMQASMAKVDAASEAKGGKPETYKISEIASVWMDQGGDARQLQDMVVEYTNLTPANAKKVANAIAKQYGLQQRIAETGAVIAEPAPEVEGAPRKTSVQRLIEQAVGVRRPIVKLEVNEKSALKEQIRLKAREARETRKARKEAARELAEAVTQYVKDNQIRGPVRARQTISLAKQALKLDVNNEKAVDRYIMYVERVVENANYDKDLSDAKALRKRAKEMAKKKTIGPEQKKVLEAIGNINPSLLDNPFEYNVLTERYLLGFLPVTSRRYSVMPDAEARQYLESLEEQMKRNQAELNRAELERFFEAQAGFAEQRGLSLEEAQNLLNEDGDIATIIQDYDLEKRKATEEMLLNLAKNAQRTLKTYDDTANTARQKELISFMQKVKLESITSDEKKRFIRFANNILANGETFGVEQFEAVAKAQERLVEAAKDKRLAQKMNAWIGPLSGGSPAELVQKLSLITQSEVDTLKNIFGREAVGVFRRVLGLLDLDVAQTASTTAKEKVANKVGDFYKKLKKKYGEESVGRESNIFTTAAAYFIQAEGNKTQEESIAYRRRLWTENIEELRKSERREDREEAEIKQRALDAITGNSNAEILNSLRSINPAAYEQLMWWKDQMHPEYKPFLKDHVENFRNQANNYDNVDYLSIHYKWDQSPELPSDLETQEFDDPVSFRIKQAANSIKRKDHPSLPVNPKTRVKANIDVNFGYNQYNSLTEQIEKAYTAPAWEAVSAFVRDPLFEQVVGGKTNADFVKNILRNIKATRTRKAMLDDENQIIGGTVALTRRISTQATLGGFTQPLRQVPDQLFKLFATTGRWDLISRNIVDSLLNYSSVRNNPLLNKLPIGRRGDARAGSQFAAEFNELARKVEASVTNKQWTRYKELMTQMGEFWMTPLRGSDTWIAKVSWMSYYEAELNKRDIKMESWEREAELFETDPARQEAAAQAEYLVDFYAGASDPTKMAALSKQGNNGWREFSKLIFLSLNSFALQQKSALMSDFRDLILRSGSRQAALAGITGTIGGMVAFHGMRIFIIGGLLYPAAMMVLKGIFGIDMDEPDEEEQEKQLRDNWRKMKASIYSNIVAGGAGQFLEGKSIDAFNRTMYLWDAHINPDEMMDDKGEFISFSKYEKEKSPFYRFRSYDKSEFTFGLADVLTEQAQRSVDQTAQLLSDEEMSVYTGNEQAYALFATGVEWAYFFRLMDTDLKRITTKLKNDIDKQAKEREAELARIRAGR